MLIGYKLTQTSIILRVKIKDTTTGNGKTGQSSVTSGLVTTTGLIISTIANNEDTPTVYTVAASHIQTITTLGTFASPSASCCRFKEVDATNHPGLYEIQLDNSRYAVTSAQSLVVTVCGVSGMFDCDATIALTTFDPYATVLTAAAIATAFLTDLTSSSDFTTSGSIGKLFVDNLNATISSRLASGSYTAPPTAASIITALFQDLTSSSDFTTSGSIGEFLLALTGGGGGGPSAATIVTTLLTGLLSGSDFSTSGSFGKLIKDNLDATISSRLASGSYTAAPTAASIITALFQDLTSSSDFTTSGSIGKLFVDNINATISSRLASGSYTAPPTAASIITALFTDLLSSSDFSTTGSIGALLKTLTVSPTSAAVATAVWQALKSGADFTTSGSIGAALLQFLADMGAYQVRVTVDTVTTAGNTAHIKVQVVTFAGELIDLSVLDPAATCSVAVIQDGNAPLFAMSTSDMGAPSAGGIFEADFPNPNFTADCGYTAIAEVVANSITYSGRISNFNVWP